MCVEFKYNTFDNRDTFVVFSSIRGEYNPIYISTNGPKLTSVTTTLLNGEKVGWFCSLHVTGQYSNMGHGSVLVEWLAFNREDGVRVDGCMTWKIIYQAKY